MLEILKDYDPVVVTMFSEENFRDLVSEVGHNPALQLINIAMIHMMDNAAVDLWTPGKEKLGDFIRHNMEEVPVKDIDGSLEPPVIDEDTLVVFDILNQFGDAYAETRTMPLVLLKDKVTGEIYKPTEEEVQNLLSKQAVQDFLMRYAPQEDEE